MTDIHQVKELEGDLEFILTNALDAIDLSIHQAGLSRPAGYRAVAVKFGNQTAERWLEYRHAHLADGAGYAAN